MVEILQDREHKKLIQSIPEVLVALHKRYDDLQLALQTSMDQQQEELHLALRQRDEKHGTCSDHNADEFSVL